ncbi:MAG: helix-turn-helix domain-containing protein [Vicinamibacterales bacterium]
MPDGLVRVEQAMQCHATAPGFDVTGPHWMFAVVTVRRGHLWYARGAARIAPPARRFAVFLPPFSIVECWLDRARCDTVAVVARGDLPAGAPREPVVTTFDARDVPDSRAGVDAALRAAGPLIAIGRDVAPASLSVRLKQRIDREYPALPPIGALAAELGVQPAVASRRFGRDYGLPPVRYRHALRVTDALIRLAGGEAIVEVAGAVGFDDLGQFYRQFGALASAPPGRYRPRSRNPKTGPTRP